MKKEKISRFKMLKTATLLIWVLAWVSLLGGLALAVIWLAFPNIVAQIGIASPYNSAWLSALAMLIGGVLYGIVLFAAAEFVQVFLSMEENLKKLRELLDKK